MITTVLIPDHAAPLTRQSAFDLAYRWALGHGYCYKPTPSDEGANNLRCLYRSIDGDNACLMGCLIPDSVYQQSFDDGGPCASKLHCRHEHVRALFTDEVTDSFLDALQAVHDLAAFGGKRERNDLPPIPADQYHANLRAFAAEQGLTVPAV